MRPSDSPNLYDFQEQPLFARDRERIIAEGVSEYEFDQHLFAIQDAVAPDPFEAPWSVPVSGMFPGVRQAVSEGTPAEPNALLVLFTVEGQVVKLERVRLRDA